MAKAFTIALDAMGGDRAPESVLRGANMARERHPGLRFIFFGDQVRLQPLLSRLPRLAQVSEIVHCSVAIPDDMKAAQALRMGRESSMGQALEAVRSNRANGFVSAGNTGAMMALSKLLLGMIPGIHRPAIAAFFPTEYGECVMLDLGANVVCDTENLIQFAQMGHVFGEAALGWKRPRVALLNVGVEHQKGREELREAAARLMSMPEINYTGFVEANHIPKGGADVIVTDGFTGNVALKMAEGTAALVSNYVRNAFRYSWLVKLGYVFIRPALARLRLRLDPRRYNGAVFLGLNHVAVKSHGRSDAIGFAAAIDVAVEMLEHQAIEKIATIFSVQKSSATA